MRIPRLMPIDIGRNFTASNVITNRSPINEKTKIYTDDGVFSERIFGKTSIDTITYTCNCNNPQLQGKFYEGVICPVCNSEVREQNSALAKTGWITFENEGDQFMFISPIFYEMMAKIVGKTEFQKVLNYNVKLDLNGNVITENTGKKYHCLGMYKFYSQWIEVLSHYCGKDQAKKEKLEFIIKNKDIVFTSKMPVISVALRPAIVSGTSIKFAEINNFYNYLIGESNGLKTLSGEMVNEYNINQFLWRAQVHVNCIYKYVIEAIGGKNKYLRNHIFGTRVNFSARNVISPLDCSFYNINEIKLPYLTCMELYKFELINMYRCLKKCSLLEANDAWSLAVRVKSDQFMNLIKELIASAKSRLGLNGLPVLINRNPTIQLGSILRTIVVGVKEDSTDLTMSVHNCILTLLAGDYDGDVLAIIKIPDLYFYESFEVFDPAYSLSLSREKPGLSTAMYITKEHGLGMLLLTEI